MHKEIEYIQVEYLSLSSGLLDGCVAALLPLKLTALSIVYKDTKHEKVSEY